MPNVTNEDNWSARERLRRIEFLLWWRGWVGRPDLLETFGISAAQASSDLQRYAETNPNAMVYHTSRKRYEAAKGMKCKMVEPCFSAAVRVFLDDHHISGEGWRNVAGDDRLAAVALPHRAVDQAVARRIMMALLNHLKVRVRHLSVENGGEDAREIVPGALGYAGGQWHLRAWNLASEEWEDLVLSRIVSAEWPSEPAGDLPKDKDWEAVETLKLRVNPKLDDAQRKALKLDYGLSGDTLTLHVRRAMKPYLLGSLFIESDNRKQVVREFELVE